MPFVLDASVTCAWLLPDEENAFAERCLDALTSDMAIVPAIWWFEVRAMLITAERRGRLAVEQTRGALALLARYPIEQDRSPEEATMLRLARKHDLTIYDASYLELALRLALPLATLDRKLETAATGEKLRPMPAL